MLRYYDPEDVRQADVLAVEKYGLPSLYLMENAGTNAAHEVLKRFPNANSFLIFEGPGNNGGDGFVAAKSFLKKSLKVTLILSSDMERYKGDSKLNLDILIKQKDPNFTIKQSRNLSDSEIKEEVSKADCLIDALLGTGSKGAPKGEIERLIRFCKKDGAVVAFDLPSGIDSLTGNIFDPCVKADLTITFLAAKKGMCFSPAYEMCGTVVIADIGISSQKVLEDKESIYSVTRDDIPKILPRLSRNIHKGSKGGLLIVGGNTNYRGAPLLAGLGALRSGAGLVVIAIPDFMVNSAALFLPEAIFVPLRTMGGEIVSESFNEAIAPWINRCGTAVVGPGLGRNESAEHITNWFWNEWKKPLLADGDALYFLSSQQNRPDFRADVVITPHSGEAANLLGITSEEVNKDRIGSASLMSLVSKTVLLKGMDTVVYSKGKSITIIKEGSPALAVPGSGDVLSGAIGALMSSGMSNGDAALVGAAAHGAAGSILEKKLGIRGILAREIADALPFTLN